MKTPVQKINDLLIHLPNNDVKYANKFIKDRDFESLRDLVKSDITIVLKRLDGLDEFQKDLAVEGLRELYSEVDSYCNLLGCDKDECFDEEDSGEENYV